MINNIAYYHKEQKFYF